MNRWLLFAFVSVYPTGGIQDLKGDFKTLEEAKNELARLVKDKTFDFYQIVDLKKKAAMGFNYYGDMVQIWTYVYQLNVYRKQHG